MSDKPLALCLMGPTASGKTDLALQLCDEMACEIISVDSALVYKGMDIGTAKPDAATLAKYPHALVDILDPSEVFSAADFVTAARAEMAAILERGNTPLLVGGTMMYFKALMEGLAEMPAADETVRAEILELARASGWQAVHDELAKVDHQAAERIHPNHSQRLSRALEVYRISGKPISQWQREQGEKDDDWRYLSMAVAPRDRSVLHARIETRFRNMLKDGFLEEVITLRARGDLNPDLPSMRAVGYRQAWQYLEGQCDADVMLQKGLAATRQLAKRQLTWLRKWPELHWLDEEKETSVIQSSVNPYKNSALQLIRNAA